jgi:hypothetical protein
MSSTAVALISGGPIDVGTTILGATMSASRNETSLQNSLGATLLFGMLGLTLSLFLIGQPREGVAAQEYMRVFVAAHLQ